MTIKLVTIVFLCLTLSYVGSVSGEEGKVPLQSTKQYQIVFSTFDKSSAGSYSYLRDSIQAMLSSRLAAKDRVKVLEKTFSEEELNSLKKKGTQKGLSIGGENADYLVTGALFSLTSGLEVQVDLYPLVVNEEILYFSVRSKTTDSLIADVEQLTQDIAQTAFGYRSAVPGTEAKSVDVGGNKGFVTVHPEAAYKRNLYTGTVIGVAGSGVITKGRGAKMTATVPVDMRAMAVGDVNGNGEKEILLLAGQDLRLFSAKDNAITRTAETSLPSNLVIHAMNLADLDGDGKEEIYLSGTDGLYVSSMIMKYDPANGFQIVSRNIPWYVRPLFIPEKGLQLVGQQRGVEKINLVNPGLYLLTLDPQGEVTKGERMALPTSVNLFDFVYADLDGDGFSEIVVVDQKEKLRVYNPGNELMWVSQKNFASSKIYLGPSRGGATGKTDRRNFTPDEDADRDLVFVPARIIVTDINKDGKQEIVVSEGTKTGFSFFNRLRLYDSGAVVSMAWTGSTLVESWRTGNYRGYVAGYDFIVMDTLEDQKKTKNDTAKTTLGRLFLGYLPKSGSLADLVPGGSETELIVYDLEFTHEKMGK